MEKKSIIRILIINLFCLYLNNGHAQELRFGLYGDPKLSWMTPVSKSIDNKNVATGINYGFYLDKFFAENYAFSTGLSIDNMGAGLRFTDTFLIEIDDTKDSIVNGSSIDYHLQYVRLPIGLKLFTDEMGYIKFYADLGLTTGFNIKATADYDTLDKADIMKEISFLNLGYHFGIGIQYSLGGTTALNFGILYTNGFWNVTGFKDKVTLSNVALRIGIVF